MEMIEYEKAKELKDAGFPQEAVFGTWFYSDKGSLFPITEDLEGLHWDNYSRCPTISELTRSCFGDFQGFRWIDFEPGKYVAIGVKNGVSIFGGGSGPEEAVANLWLALNEKDG